MARSEAGVIGWQVCHDLDGVERIYAMRKKAVGLLGNAKGAAKPIPFAEDTCRPARTPGGLYLEFRALLDSHGPERTACLATLMRGAARAPGAGYVRSAAGGADEADLR